MFIGEVRKVSRQEIQLVQNLIERCLQLYMSQKEVMDTLLVQAKIEPGFTELVWQKLEEENQDFFEAYNLRLMVKDQILKFNKLLDRQVELMSLPLSNGSNMPPVHQNSASYSTEQTGPALKPDNMRQSIGTGLPNAFTNGGSSLHQCMQTTLDMSAHSRMIDVPPNVLLAQSSNMGMIQGMNGGMIKSEAGYIANSQFVFGAGGNNLETRPAIGDASGSSFSSVESNSQPLNETILDADASSFGFLGQIPRNFSLSDLTADFSNNILESYSGSPFLAADTDNFFGSHRRGEHQGDNERLDTISEGLSYEDFCSD